MAEKKKAEEKTKAAKKEAKPQEKKEVKAKAKPKAKAAKKGAAKAPEKVAKGHHRSCQIGGCKRAYRAKGYCRVHYRKWRHGEYGKTRYKHCHAKACMKPMVVNFKGFCEDHYKNKYLNKGPGRAVEAPAAEESAA